MDKVYIVTSGCYSDYRIEKVFSTKEKAENYIEWCGDSEAVIEVFSLDNLSENEKYYKIETKLVYHKEETKITQEVYKTLIPNNCILIDEFERENTKGLILKLYRSVEAENFDNEKHLLKYKKAIYDFLAITRQKLTEGHSIKDIKNLLFSIKLAEKEDFNASNNN